MNILKQRIPLEFLPTFFHLQSRQLSSIIEILSFFYKYLCHSCYATIILIIYYSRQLYIVYRIIICFFYIWKIDYYISSIGLNNSCISIYIHFDTLRGGYGYFFQKFSYTFFSLRSIVHSFKSILWKFEVDPRKIDEDMDILVNPPPYRILAPTAHKSSWGKPKR